MRSSPTPAHSATSVVPSGLRERASREGRVRVIAELRLPSHGHVGEGGLSRAGVTVQRADIAGARRHALARLAGRHHRVVHQFDTIPLVALEVDVDALAELEASTFWIARVVEDKLHVPSLPDSVPLIGGTRAWSRGFDGTGTVVAIVDTGIEAGHPFLAGKVVEEACYSTTTTGASPSTTVCPNRTDEQLGPGAGAACELPGCWHGTHVAGIAAGNGAGAGVGFSGVAKGAAIMSVQVFSRFASATDCAPQSAPCVMAWTSDVIAGLERVYALRAVRNIAAVNMSLGGETFTTTCDGAAHKPIIDNLRSVGIATVVAAGNNAATNAVSSPACVSSAVSVGATTKTDTVASFSNAAPFLSLFAPGDSIGSSFVGGGWAIASGTSMAAPHVTGAWAVLKQAAPSATVTQILSALQATGVSVTDARSGGTVTRPRIAVDQALTLVAAAPVPPSLSLTYNGKVRDRVGQDNVALGADGVLDATLTATLTAGGTRTVTGLQLRSSTGGTWETDVVSQHWVLGMAATMDGLLLNDPRTIAVNVPLADGASFAVFAADYENWLFPSGTTLTLTATFSDGASASATTTVSAPPAPAPPPPPTPAPGTLTLVYNGKARDRVGQDNIALGGDGVLDGTLTATLNTGGGRTVTGLQLLSSTGGTWETDLVSQHWVLGMATTLDGPLLNDPRTTALNVPVADGGSFVVFAADYDNWLFPPGTTLTLTATFADGSSVSGVATVP